MPSGTCVYGERVSVCLAFQLSLHTVGGCGILDDRKQTQARPRRLTFHISAITTSCASVCVSVRAWRGQRGAPLCQFHVSCFVAVLFFPRPGVRSLLNVNTFKAGLEGDRETNEGLLKGCVCDEFVGWPRGREPHHLKPPSICLPLPRNLRARCRANPLATSNSTTSPR